MYLISEVVLTLWGSVFLFFHHFHLLWRQHVVYIWFLDFLEALGIKLSWIILVDCVTWYSKGFDYSQELAQREENQQRFAFEAHGCVCTGEHFELVIILSIMFARVGVFLSTFPFHLVDSAAVAGRLTSR